MTTRFAPLATVGGVLIFANVVDMGGGFGLKYASYLLLFLGVLSRISHTLPDLDEIVFLGIVFVLWPLFALWRGVATGGDLSIGINQFTPFLPSVLLAFYIKARDAETAWRAWYLSMQILAAIICILFAAAFALPDNPVLLTTLDQLNIRGQGYFGVREFAGLGIPNIYFKATLFFVPAFVYGFVRQQWLSAGLFLTVLALSFSKAGVAYCLAFCALVWISQILSGRMLVGRLVLIVGAVTSAYVLFGDVLNEYSLLLIDAIAGNAYTTSVRIGHAGSLWEHFSTFTQHFVFGQGVGTAYYSSGAGGMVTDIELDHLDSIRQFGILWFAAFCLYVIYVVHGCLIAASRTTRAAGLALIAIFFVAGTNPVLINPLTLMLFIIASKLKVEKDQSRSATVDAYRRYGHSHG